MKLTEYAKSRGDIDVDPQVLDDFFDIETPKRRKPKNYETFWYVDEGGGICPDAWMDRDVDEYCYKMRNVFPDEESAAFERERREIIAELKNYAEEHNECELDWGNSRKTQWCIFCNHSNNTLGINESWSAEILGSIYFASSETAQAAIDTVGANRIKKYVFGVVD